ncbi:hypothetical protein JHK82_050334 [Glycine max]|nr:hypothetical protein JHK85_050971 [Glycine max]KAG5091556.1 hypothetical protein JHK82_050334 [Glycine max]
MAISSKIISWCSGRSSDLAVEDAKEGTTLSKVAKMESVLEADPTQHTAIDNLMVQQLDGTINEWGWCKQKVLS